MKEPQMRGNQEKDDTLGVSLPFLFTNRVTK